MTRQRTFGEVPGVPVGAVYPDRKALSAAGVHRPLIAGISGGGDEGADSIVLSGGYEDDEDHGDVIVYTGHGGNDPATGQQIADQILDRGNKALSMSCLGGLPVRVVRGAGLHSPYAPKVGYRYDGLYRVESYWPERGRSGFQVWRFRLVREGRAADGVDGAADVSRTATHPGPPRRDAPVPSVARSTAVARVVAGWHEQRCQVCGARVGSAGGPYGGGVHARPLWAPHNGPDRPDNVLHLCPNDHIRFDTGAIRIADDLTFMDASGARLGRLRTAPQHRIAPEHLAYRRGMFAPGPAAAAT